MVKNEKVYDAIQNIVTSQEYKLESIDNKETAVSTVKHLRNHVKTLISIVYDIHEDNKALKRIADMLQTVERAKTKLVSKTIDKSIREDHHDIMSYDARKGGTYDFEWVKDSGL